LARFESPRTPLRWLADRAPGWARQAWRRARRGFSGAGGPPAAALAALPDQRVHDAARSLQLELERRYGANPGLDAPPHITLKLGFEVGRWEPFERYLDELAATTEPFELAVGDLGFFDEGVVFLEVERHPRLEALRRRILADLRARFGVEPYLLEAGDAFRFHVTVARDLAPVAFADARRSLQVSRPALRFRLERLALLRSAGEGWVAGRTATLTGPGPSPRNVG
jgi:2'-5' RNA ligase